MIGYFFSLLLSDCIINQYMSQRDEMWNLCQNQKKRIKKNQKVIFVVVVVVAAHVHLVHAWDAAFPLRMGADIALPYYLGTTRLYLSNFFFANAADRLTRRCSDRWIEPRRQGYLFVFLFLFLFLFFLFFFSFPFFSFFFCFDSSWRSLLLHTILPPHISQNLEYNRYK